MAAATRWRYFAQSGAKKLSAFIKVHYLSTRSFYKEILLFSVSEFNSWMSHNVYSETFFLEKGNFEIDISNIREPEPIWVNDKEEVG